MIISIVGSFRTGKSFILNAFLQYLKYGKPYPGENGFHWAYGSNSHTKGIWMWNTPIDYKLNDQDVKKNALICD